MDTSAAMSRQLLEEMERCDMRTRHDHMSKCARACTSLLMFAGSAEVFSG